MVANGVAVTGGAGGLLLTTFLSGSLLNGPDSGTLGPMPPSPVNVDRTMLSSWTSESLDGDPEPLASECAFWNFSSSFTGEFCTPFAISRMNAATISTAEDRALRCAAKHSTECVLSFEVGLAAPAAFVGDFRSSRGMKALIAPKTTAVPDAVQRYVRAVHPVDGFVSRTLKLDDALEVEFMTSDKRVTVETLRGEEAFCVGMLRSAYDKVCWEKLD